jgi:hypothetical protein
MKQVNFPIEDDDTKTNAELAEDPFYSAANMERLRASALKMESTGGTVHEIGALSDDDESFFRCSTGK